MEVSTSERGWEGRESDPLPFRGHQKGEWDDGEKSRERQVVGLTGKIFPLD